MTSKLFGTDGIRSQFGIKPLTTDIIKLIGYAFAKSMFNKYRLKVSFLEYNKERGSFTI